MTTARLLLLVFREQRKKIKVASSFAREFIASPLHLVFFVIFRYADDAICCADPHPDYALRPDLVGV
jgi:hypothetical protein